MFKSRSMEATPCVPVHQRGREKESSYCSLILQHLLPELTLTLTELRSSQSEASSGEQNQRSCGERSPQQWCHGRATDSTVSVVISRSGPVGSSMQCCWTDGRTETWLSTTSECLLRSRERL
ncbi:hypothetical protein DNTS_003325 [Danionella cerebrum]|uniref:Uncharacterized protein n=1 Tax=Danionella cerebrum TaxID=2873325 RepID=A0A553QPF8_9TELE|nr:hypothetical protein DNTS_003325 [Danionella translucida]